MERICLGKELDTAEDISMQFGHREDAFQVETGTALPSWFLSRSGVGKRFRLLGHFGESRRRTRPEKTRFPRNEKFIKIYDTINWKRVSTRWKQHQDRLGCVQQQDVK